MSTFLKVCMMMAGLTYVGSAIGWLFEGKPWMSATFALYALTIATLYLAGRAS